MEVSSRITKGLNENPDAEAIRREVFVEEQGFQREYDELDDLALHLVLYADGCPAATGRTFPSAERGVWIIGRVAVRKEYRGQALGRRVLGELEAAAKKEGAREIELSAQDRARGFYEKLGYQETGERHVDEFCPHTTMRKSV